MWSVCDEAVAEQVQRQNSEYQESLIKRISVLEEQWNELAKVNEEQAQKLQQQQQPVASTSDTGQHLLIILMI